MPTTSPLPPLTIAVRPGVDLIIPARIYVRRVRPTLDVQCREVRS